MENCKIRWSVAIAWAFLSTISSSGCSLQATEVPIGIQLAERQQIVINNGKEIATLDPYAPGAGNMPEANVLYNLLEGLCNLSPQDDIIPGVAERWEESTDGKTWTFYLRPTARWSNGESVTAHDFVYSWRRLADSKTASLVASVLIDLKMMNSFAVIAGNQPPTALGVTALDDHTLELQLSQRHPFLIKILSDGRLFPVHRATVEKHGAQWTLPIHYVGNGAYRLQDWKVNEKIVLTRNPHYWNNAATRIDQATFLPLALKDAELMRYRAGEIDMSTHSPPDENFCNTKHEFQQQVRMFSSLNVSGILFNNRRVPFDNVQVRRALALALDRQALIKGCSTEGLHIAYGLIQDGAQGVMAILPVWAAWTQEKRIQEAQELLKAAGYSSQRPLSFSLLHSNGRNPRLALMCQAQWEKNLPIKVTLESREWSTHVENLQRCRYQVSLFGWVPAYSEPYAMLESLHSHNTRNAAGYRNQQFDDCLEQVMLATDQAERRQRYQQAERQLEKDMPLIPLFHKDYYRLVKPNVGGISKSNRTERIYVKDLYIMK